MKKSEIGKDFYYIDDDSFWNFYNLDSLYSLRGGYRSQFKTSKKLSKNKTNGDKISNSLDTKIFIFRCFIQSFTI